MRKWIYIVGIIIVVIIAILVGCYLFGKESTIKEQENFKRMNTIVDTPNQIENNIVANEISVSTQDKEKISPNSVLILKKQYEECSHTIREYAKMPEEYVNLTKEELEENQEGWTIESFSPNEVILVKQMAGVCNEHYMLRLKDGVIAVYQIQDDNTEILKEETGISTEYLTEIDKIRLEEGIRIYGEEELNSTLEDYE